MLPLKLHNITVVDRMLLAACRRPELEPIDLSLWERELSGGHLYHRFVERAYAHHVPGLVLSAIEASGLFERLQMEVRIVLQTHLLRQRRRSALLAMETARVCSSLRESGIENVILKGAALALSSYDAPEQRFMGDLDLLVQAGDVDRALSRLLDLGYDNPWSAEAVRGYRTYHYHLPLAHRDGQIIELHWDLVKPGRPYRLPPADLIERATPFEVAGTTVQIPSAEDQVLHTAIQQLQDGFTFLARSVDLDRIAANGSPRWDLIAERAIEGQLATAVAYACQLARCTLESPIPSDLVQSLAPGRLARTHLSLMRPVRSAVEQRFVGHPTASNLLRMWLSQGHRSRASQVGQWVREMEDHEPLARPWALDDRRGMKTRRRGLLEVIKLIVFQLATYLESGLRLVSRSGRNQMRFWSSQCNSSERL